MGDHIPAFPVVVDETITFANNAVPTDFLFS